MSVSGPRFSLACLPLRMLTRIRYLQPDIRSMQIQLTGFLDKDTPTFCKDLWKLLLSAQMSPQGVPKELLEAKKMELMQEKVVNAWRCVLGTCVR